jgi:hypothetical protein
MVLIIQLLKLVQESFKTDVLLIKYELDCNSKTSGWVLRKQSVLSFPWNGTDYTTTQAGTRIAKDGCTADQVLNLTVTPKPADALLHKTICSWRVSDTEQNHTKKFVLQTKCWTWLLSTSGWLLHKQSVWRVFLLEWYWLYNYSSWYKNPKTDVLLIKYWTWLLQLNQLKYLLQLQSVLVKLILGINNFLYSSRNIGNKWRMYCRPKIGSNSNSKPTKVSTQLQSVLAETYTWILMKLLIR